MQKNIFLLLVLLIFTSCSFNVKSTIDVPVNVSATNNLNVDVNVGRKISGQSEGTYLFDEICIQCPKEYTAGVFGGDYSKLKAAATHAAMDGTGADLIINPQYTLNREWNPLYTTVNITVTGYVGKIEGIEQ